MRNALTIFPASPRSLLKSSGNEKQQLNRKENIFYYALTKILYKFIGNFMENFMNFLVETLTSNESLLAAAVQTVSCISISSFRKCVRYLLESFKYYSWIKQASKRKDVGVVLNTKLVPRFAATGRGLLLKTAFT